jgi:putative flippase GtrA
MTGPLPGNAKPVPATSLTNEPSGRGQFLRFCVVGTLGFLVDVAVLYAAVGLLGWYAARVVSFMAAVTVTWWFNRRFTFAHQAQRDDSAGAAAILSEYCKYVGSMLGGAVVNYAAYVVTLRLVHGPFAGVAGVAAGSIAGLAVNIFAARFFVFRR